jgi:hypothetical protein
MANKLAGQRAKFTKALQDFNTTDDETVRARAVARMAHALRDGPTFGFGEDDVTQGQDVPAAVVDELRAGVVTAAVAAEDDDALVAEVATTVDTRELCEFGTGRSCVYAYGYACAPDRLKIGRADGDAVARVAARITTSTPDKPRLVAVFHTDDAGALERGLHAWFQLRERRLEGGGREWFQVTTDEVVDAYRRLTGAD